MAETKANNQSTLTIAFAVFAVVCIGAFLWFRGSDVGQLPKLVGNLGGGALFGSGIIDSLGGVMLATFIYVSWTSVGSVVLHSLPIAALPERTNNIFFYEALIVSVGAAAWSLVWLFLGLVGLYVTATAIVAVIIGLALNSIGVWRPGFRRPTRVERNTAGVFSRPIFFLIGFIVVLAGVAALAPPIAKDTLLYHFSVPKMFVTQQSSSVINGNIASYLALGTEMQNIWAMLLGNIVDLRGGEVAAAATSFLFFPLLLIVTYGWAREGGVARIWASIGTAIVAAVPTAYYVASSGYIDLSLALYITLATYALTRWWKEQTWGWTVLIAIFLGAALSVKLTAVFAVAAFALVMLLRARGAENAGRVITTGFAALLLAGVIASPWYIRTWVATGSPVFPFYMSIWPGHANGWDVERSNLFQGMNSQYGDVDQNKLNLLTAPVRASISGEPEQPANYDGVLGVAFLIGLPVLIWGLWKFDIAVEVKIAVGVAGVLYLFWLFSSEQLRYLLPILPFLAIGIAASGEAISKTRESFGKVLRCALIAACVCGLLTSFAWFCQKAPLRVVLGGETRDEYLTRNLDYYSYYQEINTNTDPSSRVWLINMRRDTYNIERPVVSDYLFEDWTLRQMVWDARSVEELRAKAGTMNVQYVLARHDFLFDYDKSTLVDDKRPRAENEAKIKMAKAFLLDPARTVKADEKFSLVKVF